MIEAPEALQGLENACPSFRELRAEHVEEHGNDLLYVAAGSFADHLLALLRANDIGSFPAVGEAIERLHTEGSPWVQEWATVGVLEGIQNVWSNNGTNPDLFLPHLGREGTRWWHSLNNFWSGKVPYVGSGA